jgi:hypothetical protein
VRGAQAEARAAGRCRRMGEWPRRPLRRRRLLPARWRPQLGAPGPGCRAAAAAAAAAALRVHLPPLTSHHTTTTTTTTPTPTTTTTTNPLPRREEELKQVKTLGEDDEDGDDLLNWVERTRQQAAAQQAAKKQGAGGGEEEDEVRGSGAPRQPGAAGAQPVQLRAALPGCAVGAGVQRGDARPSLVERCRSLVQAAAAAAPAAS